MYTPTGIYQKVLLTCAGEFVLIAVLTIMFRGVENDFTGNGGVLLYATIMLWGGFVMGNVLPERPSRLFVFMCGLLAPISVAIGCIYLSKLACQELAGLTKRMWTWLRSSPD